MIAEISSPREELRELCRRFHVRRLDLFGSATSADFDAEHSDLDFLVEFDPQAPEALSFKTFFGLKESLEALFGRSVDLSRRARFAIPISKKASSALASPSLRRDRRSLLWDASNAATVIAGMTASKSFADFDNDLVLHCAVERQFEILGEALNRLDRLDAALRPEFRISA
jgi:hypothetical protein